MTAGSYLAPVVASTPNTRERLLFLICETLYPAYNNRIGVFRKSFLIFSTAVRHSGECDQTVATLGQLSDALPSKLARDHENNLTQKITYPHVFHRQM